MIRRYIGNDAAAAATSLAARAASIHAAVLRIPRMGRISPTKQVRFMALILQRSVPEVIVQFFRHDDFTIEHVRRLKLTIAEWFGITRCLEKAAAENELLRYEGWWKFLMSTASCKAEANLPKRISLKMRDMIKTITDIAFHCPAALAVLRERANDLLRRVRNQLKRHSTGGRHGLAFTPSFAR
jgi:hypothetical protein